MRAIARGTAVVAACTIVLGCATSWVRLNDVDDVHHVDTSLSKPEMTEAIVEGAQNAGWRPKELGNDTILAVFHMRAHVVQVEIDVGDGFYVTRYQSSREMKVFCSQRDKEHLRNMKITGRQECPGDVKPTYIHSAYKTWIDSLNSSIQEAILAAQ